MNQCILQLFVCYQTLEFFSRKAKIEDAPNVKNMIGKA